MAADTAAQLRTAVLHKLQVKYPDLSGEDAAERVDRAAEYFCSQTGRQHVPPGAFYLWIDMAVRVHILASSAGQSGGMAAGAVTSVKRGDTTINYSDGAVAEAMADIYSRIAAYRVVRTR